ncbi:uncharacterized protein TNIN_144651 [Trichonephila inaurata madagascariensis]|uniref:Uncharacterized protein n=1 Tax=Trichonephila inaurata madagascariensis TaxID=2747483 RepID=A0A8X7CC88_9ARAC|nr:uncharacterized protein TNIN_144651 [Trichonephila inaurata madagascariensis]
MRCGFQGGTLLLLIQAESFLETEDSINVLLTERAVIKCLPLTYISHQSGDLLPLTPFMFLQDIRVSGTANLDMLDRNKLLVRQRFCKERQQMRSRFHREYLWDNRSRDMDRKIVN